MTEFLSQRCFLEQFDKGTAKCMLPEDFSLRCCTTGVPCFDLLDKQDQIIQDKGKGLVTYINKTSDRITVIDYENLIQSFPPAINRGKKAVHCCDFLAYSENGEVFFVCNELSTSDRATKWPDARYQFSDTVRCLLKCSETKAFIEGFRNRLCILSTKTEPIASPDGMADFFEAPYKLFVKPEKLAWTQVERMGFEIWEANSIIYENEDVSLNIR